jgi:hypothetical protein
MPPRTSSNYKVLAEIVGLCGSFLSLRERTIFFVYQSVKDFLINKASNDIFPSIIEDVHYTVFSRSLQVMSWTLRYDIYGLHAPGFPIENAKHPEPDPLAAAHYSCICWVDHLCQLPHGGLEYQSEFHDDGTIHMFLQRFFLYWLEALSLLGSISDGLVAIAKIQSICNVSIP